MNAENQFNRYLLKKDAKENLKGKFGAALLAIILTQVVSRMFAGFAGLLTSLTTSVTPFGIRRFVYEADIDTFDELTSFLRELSDMLFENRWSLLFLVFINIAVALCFTLFVSNVIRIGMRRWFLRSSNPAIPAPSMTPLFSPFKRGQYVATFKATFWKSMWIFVWSIPLFLSSMLMVVPMVLLFDAYVRTGADAITPALIDRVLNAYGLPDFFYSPALFILSGVLMLLFSALLLVKRYQYRMADYILADNPHVGTRRALSLSKQMSKGSLWAFFVLDLSFAGWFILAAMCICLPGIAVLLLLPYYEATWVEAYKNRRDYMVSRRELTMEELGYVRMWPGY